jgi:hypothetical protein
VAAATAVCAATVCCIWAAAAASSAEGSSALSAKAVLMCAGRVLRKMALKRTSPLVGMRDLSCE